MPTSYMLFFITNNFINNAKLKLAKNQAKAKQHPEAKLSLFENYSLLSSMLSSKNSSRYSKNYTKTSASVLMRLLMTMKRRLKMKNRSHIYNINGPGLIHGLKYNKFKKYKMYNDGYMH